MAEGGKAPQGLNTLVDEARTGECGTSSKTVEVRGFSSDTSQDVLEMYFENSRRSGGGDIEEFQIKRVAYITFEEAEVVQRVVSRSPHQVAGQTLTVTLSCPPLQKSCYENRVLVQNLNSAVTEELLTNFLEIETERKVTEFLYGEGGGKVVVTFSNLIDFAALRKACKERGIEGTFLHVTKVAISNCIFVKNLQPSASHDVILFYFENKRRSGGGEVKRVKMNTADSYCLVYFEDHDVIDSVLCQQHKIDGAYIEVHLHHECLGRRSSRSRFNPLIRISEPDVKNSVPEIPPQWNPMDRNNLMVIPLQAASKEYAAVASCLLATVKKERKDASIQIVQIERIQNKTLYAQYQSKKKLIVAMNPGQTNEMDLWHGTAIEAVDSINMYGFNRSLCGKNATSLGQGISFAKEACHSARDIYSVPDAAGNKRMYLTKVLTGKYVKGASVMRVPPPLVSGRPELHDSVVDNVNKPFIFVIFQDTQAYPEYLITFRWNYKLA